MFNYTINTIINIFLVISFCIMVAGFAAYLFQEINIPKICGIAIIAILSFITFLNNINGIIKVNCYLVPLLITVIILLGIKNITNYETMPIMKSPSIFKWFWSSILYVSYNSIVLIPMLVNLKKYVLTKKQAILISIIVTFIILLLALIIYMALYKNFDILKNTEIPITYIASKYGTLYKYIYGAIILIAIFTSATSAGYSFLKNCAKTKKQYLYFAIVIEFIAMPVATMGFSNMVNLLYPIFGYLGMAQMFFLLKNLKNV